jgi:prepilin-type N-terminal cleavage/methylation domain-containing protein
MIFSFFRRRPFSLLRFAPRPISRGFTLVEVLTTIVIFSSIMIAVATFQHNVLNFNRSSGIALNNTHEAQALMKTMARELRSMEPSSNGSYPIAAAGTSTITFFADPDGDSLKDQIRYYLVGTTLYRGITRPTGTPPTYVAGNETTRILVTGLRNSSTTPVFEYFNSSYAGTSTPLTYPLNIPVVRLVRANLTIDTDPNKSPLVRTFTTQAALRNLKDNL